MFSGSHIKCDNHDHQKQLYIYDANLTKRFIDIIKSCLKKSWIPTSALLPTLSMPPLPPRKKKKQIIIIIIG